MTRLVYACQFEVTELGATALIKSAYADWINERYRRRYQIADCDCAVFGPEARIQGLPPQHDLTCAVYPSSDGNVSIVQWTFPAENDRSLIWRNEIRIGELNKSAVVEHAIWIDSSEFRIAPVSVPLGSPSVVRRLCSERIVRVGQMQVRATPYLFGPESVSEFITLLENPLRRLPIVLLTPYTDDDACDLDGDDLAKNLAGVAVVAKATDAATTWEIAEGLGRALSCYDGAVRIYWPGFSLDDDPRRHPLYFADRIQNFGAAASKRHIERLIFSVASFRFSPDARLNAIIRTVQDSDRALRLEEKRADSSLEWEEIALELDDDFRHAQDRIGELEAENANLRANQTILYAHAQAADADGDAGPQDAAALPRDNLEAVQLAGKKLPNLIILGSALEAATECPFKRPQEILAALQDLNALVVDWEKQKIKNGSGGDLRQHLISRGWGKRCSLHISDTTRKMHKERYTFTYGDSQRLFEPHITIGAGDANSCASIHFIFDETKKKIVVAHVGRHLPNTKT